MLDGFSRKGVGWAMANPLRPERVLAALNMARGQRRPEGVVHHSDNGTRYTSLAFGKRCREMGVVTSTGDGYDNAMAGSFFATPECERLDRRAFHTQVEARMAIFEFIEGWDNTHRRHSALGSLSPNDFERAAAKAASRAPGNDDRLGRIDLEAFRIDEPEAPNHPPGRPSTSVFGKMFLPSAFAHPRAGSESHHLSTRSG